MSSMSEYLLECLRKRQAGFLNKFCGILTEIEAAKYLGDHIRKAYNKAKLQGGMHCTYYKLLYDSCLDTVIINTDYRIQYKVP